MLNLENKVVTHLTIYADSSLHNNPSYVYAKQYDSHSRYIVVRIKTAQGDVDVSTYTQLNATKPDGTHAYVPGEANEDGTVTFELTPNLLTAIGQVSCDISVHEGQDADGNELLTTSTFFVLVEESNYHVDAIESTDEFTTIVGALAQIVSDRKASEDARDNATQSANIATQAAERAVQIADETQAVLSSKADGLSLNGYTLQLKSGEDVVGNAVDLPIGVNNLQVRDEKLYLRSNDTDVGNGVDLPQQVNGLTVIVENSNNMLYLTKNGETLGTGVVLPKDYQAELDKLSQWYDREHYVVMTGTFAMSPTTTTYAIGTSTDVVFNWTFSKTPSKVTFNNNIQPEASEGSISVRVESDTHATLTYKLYGEYVEGETVSKLLSINFRNKYYYGTAELPSEIDSSFIQSLTSDGWANAKTISFTPNCGSGTYVWYAYPVRLGIASMWMGGFQGGFEEPLVVPVTNVAGFTENYYVYRSTNSGIGSLSIQAK